MTLAYSKEFDSRYLDRYHVFESLHFAALSQFIYIGGCTTTFIAFT